MGRTDHMRPSSRVVVATLVLAVAACRPEVGVPEIGVPEPPPGHTPPTTVGDFDAETLRRHLQGRWVVRRGDRLLFEFDVDGDGVRVVDHRPARPSTRTGDLVLRSATGFGVEGEDGTTRYYSFVQDGGEVFMGPGAALAASEGEPFVARLGAWEELVYYGESCRYVAEWGEVEVEEDVTCGFEERAERRVFTYETPEPYRRGRGERHVLYVVGGHLLDRELAESRAVRRSKLPGFEALPAGDAGFPSP